MAFCNESARSDSCAVYSTTRRIGWKRERTRYPASTGNPVIIAVGQELHSLPVDSMQALQTAGRPELAARARRAREACTAGRRLFAVDHAVGRIRTFPWICAIADINVAAEPSTNRVGCTLAARARFDGRYAGIDTAANVRPDRLDAAMAMGEFAPVDAAWGHYILAGFVVRE